MRTPTLQYLYLQKPITLMLVICLFSVIPWIGLGDFSTKGEPREANVAVSMIESGNWSLPDVYANEFSYKPPLYHWMVSVFSLPIGHVTEFTARLPSALAFILLCAFSLFFFGRRTKFHLAFVSVLLCVTCFELHRAAITARVDMLLTFFIVSGLYSLYEWENTLELKGLPPLIPILLGCAILTKGPVGVILPLFVFFVYLLLLQKYSLLKIVKSVFFIGFSSLFLPSLWYISAYQRGGSDFLAVTLAENFGRFLHINIPNINYDLGHRVPFYYNFLTLLWGSLPWTLLAVFALFGFNFNKTKETFKNFPHNLLSRLKKMDKVKLFSLVAIICIVFFYCIPSSKRSVYLMPVYPFLFIFLAEFLLFLTENRTRVTRVFASIMSFIGFVFLILFFGISFRLFDPLRLLEAHLHGENTMTQAIGGLTYMLRPDGITWGIVLLIILSLGVVLYQIFRRVNIKMLYATIGLTLFLNMFIDGVVMRGTRKMTSPRAFVSSVQDHHPEVLKHSVYVMNDLLKYKNLYGLRFYWKEPFENFEIVSPTEGYLFVAEKDLPLVESVYKDYTFTKIEVSSYLIGSVRQRIILTQFKKIA